MLVLFIISFARVSSGALVHVVATAVEEIVGLAHTLRLLSGSADGCSFWYRPFGNFGAFIRPRIGLTAIFLIWSVSSLGNRRLGVVATPAFAARPLETGPEVEAYRGPAPSPRFPSYCRSAQAQVSQHPSSRKFAILWATVAPATAMSPSTPSAESFAVTWGWPVWKCIECFKD